MSNTAIEVAKHDVVMPSRTLRFLEVQAAQIAATSLAGQYKGKPEELLPVLVRGAEIGLKPMESVEYLYNIEGRIYPASKMVAALFRNRGHWYHVDEYGSERCVIRARHKLDPPEDVTKLTFAIADARRMGLLDIVWKRWAKNENNKSYCAEQWLEDSEEPRPAWAKAGTKNVSVSKHDNWFRDPASMLFYKAVRRIAEIVDPSVLMALPENEWLEEATTAVVDSRSEVSAAVMPAEGRIIDVEPEIDDDPKLFEP